MGKVGASILGGAVGLFTGGIGGAIAGAAQPWVTPPPPAQTRTGATAGGPSAPGLGAAGAGLPTMTGSGLGTLTPSAMPGAPAGQFFGTPAAQPTFTPRPTFGGPPPAVAARTGSFADRLRAMRTAAPPVGGAPPRAGSFAARLAAIRAGAPPPIPTFPIPPPPSPVPLWVQALQTGTAFFAARRAAAPPTPRVESIFDQPRLVSPSGVVSIF